MRQDEFASADNGISSYWLPGEKSLRKKSTEIFIIRERKPLFSSNKSTKGVLLLLRGTLELGFSVCTGAPAGTAQLNAGDPGVFSLWTAHANHGWTD